MHFLHIRPVDDEVLKIIMPNGWWAGKSGPEDPEAIAYKATCDSLKHHIQGKNCTFWTGKCKMGTELLNFCF